MGCIEDEAGIWKHIEDLAEGYRKSGAEAIYQKIVDYCEERKQQGKPFIQKKYNDAQEKVAFYRNVALDIKDRQISLRFTDIYRQIIGSWIDIESGIRDERCDITWIPHLFRGAMDILSGWDQIYRIGFPLRGYFSKGIGKLTSHDDERTRIMKRYISLERIRDFRDVLKRLEIIETGLHRYLEPSFVETIPIRDPRTH